ncbi:hypothetical protein TrLO_g4951 [Triparma laevis f. longispina]|uniref:Myb-like domain-containing protein n=2 Tax=Triparma laevis f. longispina TaxID=1714387 RepID=A0A9W7FRF8_9STRA|nr:hypothetical protein TrLO_g4951 [Triparma laevis f. longispina]
MPPKQPTPANRPQRSRKSITAFQPTMKGDRKILKEEGVILNSTATMPIEEYANVYQKESSSDSEESESGGEESGEEESDSGGEENGEEEEVKVRTGAWTPLELTKITSGLQKYGSNWPKISSHIPGRTAVAIEVKYRRLKRDGKINLQLTGDEDSSSEEDSDDEEEDNAERRGFKTGAWSNVELGKLKLGLKQHGTDWGRIQDLIPERSISAIENRGRKIATTDGIELEEINSESEGEESGEGESDDESGGEEKEGGKHGGHTKWTEEENETLRSTISEVGNDWKKIHLLLPHRTLVSVEGRGRKILRTLGGQSGIKKRLKKSQQQSGKGKSKPRREVKKPTQFKADFSSVWNRKEEERWKSDMPDDGSSMGPPSPRKRSASTSNSNNNETSSGNKREGGTRVPWSEKEDVKLSKMLEKYGKDYERIGRKFPDRSSSALRHRGDKMLGRMEAESKRRRKDSDDDEDVEEEKEEAEYYQLDADDGDDSSLGSISALADRQERDSQKKSDAMRKKKTKKALKRTRHEGKPGTKYLPEILDVRGKELPMGTYVLTKFEGQQFFKGMVNQVEPGRVHVNYTDGDTEWIKTQTGLKGSVFPISRQVFSDHVDGSVLWPKVGWNVEVMWGVGTNRRKIFFPAKVLSIVPEEGKCLVRYEDESEYTHDYGVDYPETNIQFPEVEYEAAVDRPDSELLGIRRVYTEEGTATTKYMSRLMYNGIAYVLGEFESKEDAALAHDAAQRELHGKSAIVNYVTKVKSCEEMKVKLKEIIKDTNEEIGFMDQEEEEKREGMEVVKKEKEQPEKDKEQPEEDKGKKRKLSVSVDKTVKVEGGESTTTLKTPKSSNTSANKSGDADEDGTEWRYKKEIENLSGTKRQRKQVATFQPSFLNDRRLLEEQAKTSPGLKKSDSQDSNNSNFRRQNKRKARLNGRTTMKLEWWMSEVKEGTQVEANWQGLGGFYPGTIYSLNDKKKIVTIHYDDGDVEGEVEAYNVRILTTHDEKKKLLKQKQTLIKEENATEREKKKEETEAQKREQEKKEVETAKKAKRDAIRKQKLQEAKREAARKKAKANADQNARRKAAREAAKAKALLEGGDGEVGGKKKRRRGSDDEEEGNLDFDDEFGIVAGTFGPKEKKSHKRSSNRPERQTKKKIGTWQELDEEAYFDAIESGNDLASIPIWPSYGDYVKVFYAEGSGGEWYFGRVCDMKKDAGIVVVQYDNGEVYEEDFPGENVDDFVIISYKEYKKHNGGGKKGRGASTYDRESNHNAYKKARASVQGIAWGKEPTAEEKRRVDAMYARYGMGVQMPHPPAPGMYGLGQNPNQSMPMQMQMPPQQQQQQPMSYRQEKTEFKGVWKKGPSFIVKVMYKGDKYLIGEYQSAQEACYAYDDVVFDMYGDSACNYSFGDEVGEAGSKGKGGNAGLIGVVELEEDEWQARIANRSLPGEKIIDLGTFDTKEEAVRAYDQMCLGLRGEHAICNDMEMNMFISNMKISEEEEKAEEEEALKQVSTPAPLPGSGILLNRLDSLASNASGGRGGPRNDIDLESPIPSKLRKLQAELSVDQGGGDKVVNKTVGGDVGGGGGQLQVGVGGVPMMPPMLQAAAVSRVDVTPAGSGEQRALGGVGGERPVIDTGVYVNTAGIWKARLIYMNQLFDLGSFVGPREASLAYENARAYFVYQQTTDNSVANAGEVLGGTGGEGGEKKYLSPTVGMVTEKVTEDTKIRENEGAELLLGFVGGGGGRGDEG